MDGQWLKITKNLFDSSCDTIDNKILAKIKQTDLTQLQVLLPSFLTRIPNSSCSC